MTSCPLLLVRHGATPANLVKPYVLQGRGTDHSLSPRGIEQATALAEALASRPIAAVLASPLKRAQETAAFVARRKGLAVETAPTLIEADVGCWEGLSWQAIEQRYPKEFAAFQEDEASTGYLQGENFLQVRDRALPTLEALADRFDRQTVVVVSHHITIRVMLAHWLNIPLRFARRLPAFNAGFAHIDMGATGKVLTINDVSHLDGLLGD